MNTCVFTGRTTDAPEIRRTHDGLAIASFTLAVDDGFGDKKVTSFFRMTAFGKSAETMEKYLGKGIKIAVVCRAREEKWTDKNGNKRSSISFLVDGWEFAQAKEETGLKTQISKPEDHSPNPGDDDFMDIPPGIDEELPFV